MKKNLKLHQLSAIKELDQLCRDHAEEAEQLRNQKQVERNKSIQERKQQAKLATIAKNATEKEVLVVQTGTVQRGDPKQNSRAMYQRSIEQLESTYDHGSVFLANAQGFNSNNSRSNQGSL